MVFRKLTKKQLAARARARRGRRPRRRLYKRKQSIYKPQMGLSKSVMPFTRERETYFILHDLTGAGTSPFNNLVHTADGGVAGNLDVKLSDFPSSSDFTNLFRQYKINYLKVTFYPASNTTIAGDDSAHNNNILIRTMYNKTGIAMGAGNTISEWSQVQAKKQWLLARNKPTTITCPLSMLYEVNDGTTTGTAVGRPRYISTNNPSVPFFGLNLRFDSCDGTALSAGDVNLWPSFRVVAKIYLTCKGVA